MEIHREGKMYGVSYIGKICGDSYRGTMYGVLYRGYNGKDSYRG